MQIQKYQKKSRPNFYFFLIFHKQCCLHQPKLLDLTFKNYIFDSSKINALKMVEFSKKYYQETIYDYKVCYQQRILIIFRALYYFIYLFFISPISYRNNKTAQDHQMLTNYTSIIKSKASDKILCIGDIAIDRYVSSTISRSHSAHPIQIAKYVSEKKVLGCMGNLLANIKSLGGNVDAMFVTGDDEAAKSTFEILQGLGIKCYKFCDKTRKTTLKERYLNGNQLLFRFDIHDSSQINKLIENQIVHQFKKVVSLYKIVILSDYSAGMLTKDLCQQIISISNQQNVKVFVDPKGTSIEKYRGSYLVKPNLGEFKSMFNMESQNKREILQFAIDQITKDHKVQNLLVTMGSDGMVLCGQHNLLIEGIKVDEKDDCGAGDTVLATLVTMYSAGMSLPDSCKIANIAGSIIVTKFGTQAVSLSELEKQVQKRFKGNKTIYSFDSQEDVDRLIQIVNEKKSVGKSVGFTNGCFDIIHIGHISLLEQSKESCDFLIVAINDDNSVKANKGRLRPVNNQQNRAMIINSLKCVDAVVIFSDKTVDNLLLKLKPNKWFKGGDYVAEELVQYKSSIKINCECKIIPFVNGFSTTNIIQKINQNE